MNAIKDKEKILFNHYLMQKENLQRIKGDLPKGQFYLTLGTVAKDLEITIKKVRTLIKTFEALGIITNIQKGKATKTPSIYVYNIIDNEKKINTANKRHSEENSQGHSQGTVESSDNTGLKGNEGIIEGIVEDMVKGNSKKDNIKRNTKKNLFVENSNEMNLSKLLFSLMQSNNSNVKQPNFQSWSKEFDYILRIDKRDIEEVRRIIEWCQNDSFWKANILSPSSLRKQYDRLILKMKGSKLNSNNIIPLHSRDWDKEENRHYKY